jgi:predicted  nucleic acid-binding Zn-ribbon protein
MLKETFREKKDQQKAMEEELDLYRGQVDSCKFEIRDLEERQKAIQEAWFKKMSEGMRYDESRFEDTFSFFEEESA